MKPYLLISILIFLGTDSVFGQKKNNSENPDPDSTGVVADKMLPTTLPLLLFDDNAKAEKKKADKKKVRKNIYFGEKTRKGRTKQSVRDQTQYQFFNYTTQNKKIDPYIRDIYWIDIKDNVIRSKEFDPSRGHLLHGPYERIVGDNVVEKGMFYFGTKHGRWLSYDSKSILLDKVHYSEGWPKDSRVTYYNRTAQQIEKLTPIEYDLKEGNFFHFYENGQLAVAGEFKFGEKVGIWTEYWDTKNTKAVRKREIQYQEMPFSKEFRPFIRAEWDKDGNLIYRKD